MGLLDKKNKEPRKTDRIYEFVSYVEGMITGCREVENSFEIEGKTVVQRYLEVTVCDEDGRAFYLQDKSMERKDRYVRGASGVFELLIHVEDKYRGKTTIVINEYVSGCSLELGGIACDD